MTCVDRTTFRVQPYDLAGTLNSGQAFRWRPSEDGFEGVVASRWVRVRATTSGIAAEALAPAGDWAWLAEYLQVEQDLEAVVASFPRDAVLREAVSECRGLRLLRQDPWECLASFLLSSTKQIVQIRQIVELVCARFGEPVAVPAGHPPAFAFPAPERLARCTEAELRACKMGFRARYLRAVACRIAAGEPDLAAVARLEVSEARAALTALPGVGPKIAECVLLFAYGFREAFPIDVWVQRALRGLYFPRRRIGLPGLRQFARDHFGPWGGYAQQYLFHYVRTRRRELEGRGSPNRGRGRPPKSPAIGERPR